MTAPTGEAASSATTPGQSTAPQTDPAGTTPPAPQTGQAPAGTESTTDQSQETGSQQQTFPREYVERLRREAAEHRTKATGLESQIGPLQTELAKYKEFMPQRVEELQSQLTTLTQTAVTQAENAKQANLKYEVAVASQRLGIVDPEAAVAMLDRQKLEWDGAEPRNVETLLTTLLEQKPYLKAQTATPPVPVPNTGPTNPPAGHSTAGQALTLADVKKMSAEQINARWPEVQKVLSGKQ